MQTKIECPSCQQQIIIGIPEAELTEAEAKKKKASEQEADDCRGRATFANAIGLVFVIIALIFVVNMFQEHYDAWNDAAGAGASAATAAFFFILAQFLKLRAAVKET